MVDKTRHPVQLDAGTKAALEKYQKNTCSKSANDAIANLLGMDTTQPKAKKPKVIYKEHKGVPAAIIDVAILRTWENEVRYFEVTKDKTRAEIITTVKEAMERPHPNGKTWASLYPRWYKKSLDDYVNDRLQSLKRRRFISSTTKGIWTMGKTALIEDDWDLLRLVTERIHPHKELKLTDILKDRD